MSDSDLIPPNAPACPLCDSPVMIPWREWWECPRCDGVMLPFPGREVPGDDEYMSDYANRTVNLDEPRFCDGCEDFTTVTRTRGLYLCEWCR